MHFLWHIGGVTAVAMALAVTQACAGVSPSAPTRPAVDADALIAHVAVLAHDSMAGRASPSPELELAAEYVADRFRSYGLLPGGDHGTYMARYPVVHATVDPAASSLTAGGSSLEFSRDYHRAGGAPPFRPGVIEGPLILVEGPLVDDELDSLEGAIVVVDRAPGDDRVSFRTVVRIASAGARAVFTGSRLGADEWADRTGPASLPSRVDPAFDAPRSGGRGPSVSFYEVRDAALESFLASQGVDVAKLRNAEPETFEERELGRARIATTLRPDSIGWPPNVVGVLQGSDPTLANEYVTLLAHVDGLGLAPGSGEILNGADDNASGVAVLLEVARVLSAGPRPARSVLFAVVSGEEIGLLGSAYLAPRLTRPPLRTRAVISMDMLGRWWESGVVMGMPLGEADALWTALEQTVAASPDLGVTLWDSDDVEVAFPGSGLPTRSDHASFADEGVPSMLLFTSGLHDDYHQSTDDTGGVDPDAMSVAGELVARLVGSIASEAGLRPGDQ